MLLYFHNELQFVYFFFNILLFIFLNYKVALNKFYGCVKKKEKQKSFKEFIQRIYNEDKNIGLNIYLKQNTFTEFLF